MTQNEHKPEAAFGFKTVPEAEKQGMVNEVFSKAAARYDQMNDLMSSGLHRLWKDDMITMLNPPKGERAFNVLDVAGGTGDIAFRILDAGGNLQARANSKAKSYSVNDPDGNLIVLTQRNP